MKSKSTGIISRIIAAVVPLFVAGVFLVKNIGYAAMDDSYINFISRGTFTGEPDEHLFHINTVLGLLHKFFYKIIPQVNWFGIFYIIIILVVTYTVMNVLNKYLKVGFAIAIAVLLEIVLMINITYTFLAFMATAVAIIKAVDFLTDRVTSSTKVKVFNILLIVFLFESGYLLRGFSWVCTVAVMVPLIIAAVISKKVNIKYALILVVSLAVLTTSFYIIHTQSFTGKTWEEYKDYNAARAQVIDYPILEYKDHKNEYKKIGVSQNDYECFRNPSYRSGNYVFADKEYFSKDKINAMTSMLPKADQMKYNIQKGFELHFKMRDVIFFSIIFLAFLIAEKGRRKWYHVFQFLFTIGMIGILFIVGRPAERIVIPICIVGIMGMVYYFVKNNKEKSAMQKILMIVAFAIMIFGAGYRTYERIDDRTHYLESYKKDDELRKYIKNHPNNFYLADDFDFHYLYYQQPIETTGEESVRNAQPLFDYYAYSPMYYKQIEKFNLPHKDRMLMNLVEGKNVYFINWDSYKHVPWKTFNGIRTIDTIKKYLEEHTGKKVEVKRVDEIQKSKAGIYKFKYK